MNFLLYRGDLSANAAKVLGRAPPDAETTSVGMRPEHLVVTDTASAKGCCRGSAWIWSRTLGEYALVHLISANRGVEFIAKTLKNRQRPKRATRSVSAIEPEVSAHYFDKDSGLRL